MNADKLLNVRQVAEQLNVSPWTIRSWRTKGQIPFIKLHKRILFDPADIDNFIEMCKVPCKG
jgi:excisionase family DNA binding protein